MQIFQNHKYECYIDSPNALDVDRQCGNNAAVDCPEAWLKFHVFITLIVTNHRHANAKLKPNERQMRLT